MGNEAQFHYGRRRTEGGLEFRAPAKRHSAFRAATAAHESRGAHVPVVRERHAAQHDRATPTPLMPPQAVVEAPIAPVAPVGASVVPEMPMTYNMPVEQMPYVGAPAESADAAVMAMPTPLATPFDAIYQEPILSAPQQQEDLQFFQPVSHDALSNEVDLSDDDAPAYTPPSMTRRVFSYVTAAVACVVLVLSLLYLQSNKPNIPRSLAQKAGFTVYDIKPNTSFVLDKTSVQQSGEASIVYYVNQPSNQSRFVVSQQNIPAVVAGETDFQQFLSGTDKFASADSPIGKAYFTRPANIGSDISVVVKTSNSLLFIRGAGTTTDEDWTRLLSLFTPAK